VPSDRPWLQNYPPGVAPSVTYREIPLYQLLAESAARHPDLPAVRFYHHRLTYGQLWDQAQRGAAVIAALGIEPGDRVALMLPNCPQYVVAFYGALLAGAIVVQVNPLYPARELQHLLSDAGAETIVVADALYPVVQAAFDQTPLKRALVTRLRGEVTLGPEAQSFEVAVAATPARPPLIAVNVQDVAVLQYTGGTTGVAKGAMLTHFNLVANVAQCAGFNPDAPPPGESRFLTVIPLFHVYGMTVCMNLCLATGGELILLPRFDLTEVMETIKVTQPTHFPGIPTIYVAVNGFPDADTYGLNSIKSLNSGAAPMPVEVMTAFEARFGGKILEGYGLSEASPVTHGHPPRAVRKPGTVGMPVADTDCEIVDLDLGTRVTLSFDAEGRVIPGYQITDATVRAVSPSADVASVNATAQQGLTLGLQALPVPGVAGRTDEYRVRVTFAKGNDKAVSDCTLQVHAPLVSPTVPGVVAATPAPTVRPAGSGTAAPASPSPSLGPTASATTGPAR